jgi:hypothetical protein
MEPKTRLRDLKILKFAIQWGSHTVPKIAQEKYAIYNLAYEKFIIIQHSSKSSL